MNGTIYRRRFTLNTVYPHFEKLYVHVNNGNCKQELVYKKKKKKKAGVGCLCTRNERCVYNNVAAAASQVQPLSRLRARNKSCWVDWPDGTSGFSCWARTGADPGFFLGGGGCTCLLLYFNTNEPHSFFLCRIPVVLENRRSSQGGGSTPPAPSP